MFWLPKIRYCVAFCVELWSDFGSGFDEFFGGNFANLGSDPFCGLLVGDFCGFLDGFEFVFGQSDAEDACSLDFWYF